MAQQKNNNPLPISPNFSNQLIFGLFLTFLLLMIGWDRTWSIFLGILGGFVLGWISEATKSGPQASNIATSEGIDAGLKYWLFLLAGFMFLGTYPAPLSILLGALGGLGGGLIIAWWDSKEATQTELPQELTEGEEFEFPKQVSGRKRRATRRFRRPRGRINFRFWE
ncbi:hypothetical protein [Brunnivagina elsteri]|uniref:Uncharacterized protein n=1 Tax=Brunnivagina elsteri CCALA 953 TaxID=987040 RepID=A0A2A2TEE8_9CYAN|nr:hypothetical protein [Calothrix elsteri]PAX52071.1 hypothetical protein CK510_21280 [Calothrix elsteri CCALA 953]